MKENICNRLLWLSDIHFRSEYFEKQENYKDSLAPFLKSFLDLIDEQNKIRGIKTVILTGDLAFKGSKSDYDSLDKKLINPLKEILTQANFIAIPGNHDVERKGVETIFDNIKNKKVKELELVFKDYKSKTNLLQEYERFYIKLFDNYTKYLKKANINSDIIGNSSENRLFGYLPDHNNKIVYFLFNTAWFCLSASIKTIGIDEILDQIEELDSTTRESKDEIKNKIKGFFDLYAYTNENGGQLIGSNLINDTQALIREIGSSQYHEYTKITLLHHPFSWLSWEEMYSFNGDSFLRSIVENSDLVLTGHEHVPEYILPSLIFDRSWQIPAGMFLDDNIKLDKTISENFPHNRFSLLDIYPNGTEEIKFLYQPNEGTWAQRPVKYLPFHRDYKYIFDDLNLLHNKRDNFINNPDFIVSFFREQKGISLNVTNPSRHDFSNDNFVIDAYEELGHSNFWIVIRPKVDFYYQKVLATFSESRDHHLDNKLIQLIRKADQKAVYIAFLSLDLLVAPQIYESYLSTHTTGEDDKQGKKSHEEVREELFGRITQEADLHFDRYRHHFFNRVINLPFDKISALNFVNIVVPYWKIED